jgi:hypothetical protein
LAELPLVVLSLASTAMTDDGLGQLAQTTLTRRLGRLNLAQTGLTDAGAAHLLGTAVDRMPCARAHCSWARREVGAAFTALRHVVLDYTLVTPACLTTLNGSAARVAVALRVPPGLTAVSMHGRNAAPGARAAPGH